MISQTAEYALRAVVCLANQSETSLTTREMARHTKVPVNYLSKVLQGLTKKGLVQSQRGLHGGFVLSRPASEMTLLEVIDAVDPIQSIQRCPLGLKEHGSQLCPLHSRLNETFCLIRDLLRDSTVESMLKSETGLQPLCQEGNGKPLKVTVSQP